MLRAYQQRAIDELYAWFKTGNKGNPCLVMPTGSGKSHVVAALCKDALQNWPDTVVLMLTHVKELIEQNAEKMRQHWPGAPMGIYSASMGKKELGEPITFAGIQSIRNKAKQLGHVDLVIIDECHLVSHKQEGGYRKLISDLQVINPALRVIGLTASPYRLGHGLITDKPALFDDLLAPVSIEELVYKGFLSTLRSKVTSAKLDTSGVHKRGGEFIESELQAAVDTKENNLNVVREVIRLAEDRKAWLFFCAGVDHAKHVAEVLRQHGVSADCVTGETPKKEREHLLSEFKAGRIRAMTNANILTTGFDYPGIDLIAMLRPTMSASLYVQMAGRGMRIKEHTDHCLVLDFAGVVQTHGPITAVQPPRKAGDGSGTAPVKTCESCQEICHISAKSCPSCHHPFPETKPKELKLRDDDIMGGADGELDIAFWRWRVHVGKTSNKEMLAVSYYGKNLSDRPIVEYLTIMHDGFSGEKSRKELARIAHTCGATMSEQDAIDQMANKLNAAKAPRKVCFRKEGAFYRVTKRSW